MTQVESARHFYDRISGVYDALSDASEQRARQLGLRLLAPAAEDQVLEVGFGTGHAVVEIAQQLSGGGRVFGLDVSPGMLAITRKRIGAAGLRDGVVALQLGDAKQLPYADGSFDAAFASFTLELFSESEIPRVLDEIARVLGPAGRLAVVSMHDDGRKRVMVDLYRFLHRHFPHIVDCQPIDAQACLERAGFEIAAEEGVSIWGLPVAALVGRLGRNPARP